VNETIMSDGLRLAAYYARPPTSPAVVSGLVLCHGLPRGPRGAATSGATYPELADRLARDAAWVVLAFNFRGTGGSEGDFSIGGWRADLRAAITALSGTGVAGIWLAGVGEGGSLAICEAAADARVRGVAALGAPVAIDDRRSGRLLELARNAGMIRSPGFPADTAAWNREVAAVDVPTAARQLAPRPLLVVHGSDDELVPVSDARAIWEAARPAAELRVVHAAGHRLRHDPRAVALLLGWLERQQP
jgi:putative redox protein